jgi:hypothetical protein
MSDSNAAASASGGIGLVTVILALIFLFVWPGPLRYDYREYGAGGATPTVVKIDRISHQIYLLNEGKWERLDRR